EAGPEHLLLDDLQLRRQLAALREELVGEIGAPLARPFLDRLGIGEVRLDPGGGLHVALLGRVAAADAVVLERVVLADADPLVLGNDGGPYARLPHSMP